jgi:hypothetical protein
MICGTRTVGPLNPIVRLYRSECELRGEQESTSMSDDPLIPVFLPSLVVLLAHDEEAKGSPLSREEVLAIRDEAVSVMMRRSKAIEIEGMRGYKDVDPELVYEEWQVVRATMPELQPPV